MTVLAAETRGFSNTSGHLERRHQEETFMPTWAVLQCKMCLQQFFFKFATKSSSQCFQELATESLGSFKKVQKSTFFYKALPLTLANSKHHLGALNLSLEKYKTNVLKKDDILPSSQRDKMLENHPQEDEWRAYLHQEGTPILDE